MTTTTTPPTTSLRAARALAPHLLSLLLPVTTLGFLASGPHPFYAALPWLAVVALAVVLDSRSPGDRRPPAAALPTLPFDVLLAFLAAMQLANMALLGPMIAASGLLSADALVAVLLVGINTGYSAIVVAHELIHRRSRAAQLLGRALLVTTLYEHFATEHVRGHHARLGTDDDPATARFGETYGAFLRRTVPAQWKSAWELETKRLSHEGHPALGLQNRILQGIAAEVALLGALLAAFGPAAALVFVLQASAAICLLEAVNYFEHWGIRRQARKVRPVDSWDTDSWFTLHALVGLSRHADHHAHAARPYQDLRCWEESPKLPHGYLAMVIRVIFDNEGSRRLLTEELRRVGMGPFAKATTSLAA